METCRFCGARLFEGAGYCARCLTPIAASEEDVAEGLVDVAAAGGRWADPRGPAGVHRADEYAPAPPAPKVHSRWGAGATSFGPATKIIVTMFIVLVPVLMWKVLGLWAIEFGLVWCAAVAPLVLRDLWKRTRVL